MQQMSSNIWSHVSGNLANVESDLAAPSLSVQVVYSFYTQTKLVTIFHIHSTLNIKYWLQRLYWYHLYVNVYVPVSMWEGSLLKVYWSGVLNPCSVPICTNTIQLNRSLSVKVWTFVLFLTFDLFFFFFLMLHHAPASANFPQSKWPCSDCVIVMFSNRSGQTAGYVCSATTWKWLIRDWGKRFAERQQPLINAVSQLQYECRSSCLFLAAWVMCVNLRCEVYRWQRCHTC